jgi:hypothetical protein
VGVEEWKSMDTADSRKAFLEEKEKEKKQGRVGMVDNKKVEVVVGEFESLERVVVVVVVVVVVGL